LQHSAFGSGYARARDRTLHPCLARIVHEARERLGKDFPQTLTVRDARAMHQAWMGAQQVAKWEAVD